MSTERWNQALLGLEGLHELRRAERKLSRAKRFVYRDSGEVRVIDLKLRPRVMGKRQFDYLGKIAAEFERLQHNIARLWPEDGRLQRALPMSKPESAFLLPILKSKAAHVAPTVLRLDASVGLDDEAWREKLKIFEVNSVGVGGLALTPVAAEVVRELVLPHLDAKKLRSGPDTRDALAKLMRQYAAKMFKVKEPVVGIIEERDSDSGVAEYDDLAEHFAAAGLETVVGDVRQVARVKGVLTVRGKKVDVVYRDTEVKDLVAMRGAEEARAALQVAFSEGRVVSGIDGDFDHKSLLEIVTDPALDDLITPGQRELIRPHALWTRLCYPRRTSDETGANIDLEQHLEEHRERYVLKPNRSYGGVGVTVGIDTTARDWARALERAFAKSSTWVCQQLGEVMREEFPVFAEDGTVQLVRQFVDLGIYKVGDTFGVLSRAANRRVVNVSSGGGMSVVLFE